MIPTTGATMTATTGAITTASAMKTKYPIQSTTPNASTPRK